MANGFHLPNGSAATDSDGFRRQHERRPSAANGRAGVHNRFGPRIPDQQADDSFRYTCLLLHSFMAIPVAAMWQSRDDCITSAAGWQLTGRCAQPNRALSSGPALHGCLYLRYIGCSVCGCATGCMHPCKAGLPQAELHLGGPLVHVIVSE